MATKSLADMRQTARELADMVQESFVTDEWLNRRINEHCERLYDKLIVAQGELYYAKKKSVSAVVDKTAYTWQDLGASDFYRLVDLIVDDGDDYASLPSFDYVDLPRLLEIENSVGAWSVHQLARQVRATGIEILPSMGSTNFTISLYYIPSMPQLEDDEATFDGINGWERWACLGAAIDMRNKEEIDISGLMAMRSEIDAQIDQLAGTRDMGRPTKVKRTRRRYWRRWEEDGDGW